MKSAVQSSLDPLVRKFGIQSSYEAATGEKVEASDEAILAVLRALGADPDGDIEGFVRQDREAEWSRMVDPVILAWDGQLNEFCVRATASAAKRAMRYGLRLETGEVIDGTIPPSLRRERGEARFGRTRKIDVAVRLQNRLPFGYHELLLHTADGDASAFVISAPRKCYAGDRPREWGVFAPLYALREDHAQSIGDFKDLESLMHWVGSMEGNLVGTLPISAAFLREPFDPSPYSPASRLFWNELFLAESRARYGSGNSLIDYSAVAREKRAVLEQRARDFFAHGGADERGFHDFLSLYPHAVDYAQFRAAEERFERGWTAWPEPARDGCITQTDYDRRAAEYHLYAQFRAHVELSGLSSSSRECGVRLYLDLPLGVHPDSYDVWRNRDLFVTGASAGAPPDPFFTKGQNWGFPPLHPQHMREQRYSYWRAVLQTQLRYAGMLRLDHVMALHRLYFVPKDHDAREGAYVRYPAQELYAVLAVESARHNAVIIGEDLGTVPQEVRESMIEHGVKRMFVVQFEASDDREQPLGPVPKEAVASLNTHDMPPFKAYWEAGDADLRKELGLIDEKGMIEARRSRERLTTALSQQLGSAVRLEAEAARTALLRHLAESHADILLINLEDLWLEAEPQNVPGTSQERPNWRRRLKYSLPEIRQNETVRAQLSLIRAARATQKTEVQ